MKLRGPRKKASPSREGRGLTCTCTARYKGDCLRTHEEPTKKTRPAQEEARATHGGPLERPDIQTLHRPARPPSASTGKPRRGAQALDRQPGGVLGPFRGAPQTMISITLSGRLSDHVSAWAPEMPGTTKRGRTATLTASPVNRKDRRTSRADVTETGSEATGGKPERRGAHNQIRATCETSRPGPDHQSGPRPPASALLAGSLENILERHLVVP